MEVVPIFQLPFKAAFLIFIMFSFFGWCSEVLYVGIFFEHKFVNRGFLHGPLCPVYGFGGVVILLLPKELYSTWIPLFFASMILCTIVEYFVSWIMEKTFHTRWWDYSHYKLNINGRVCALNSVLFGFMGMGIIRFVYPQIIRLLNWMGDFVITISADVIAIALTADIIITVRRLVDFNTTMEKIKNFGDSLRDHYGHEEWFKGTSAYEMAESVKAHAELEREKISRNILEKIENLQAKRQHNIESFMNRFPTMKSIHYTNELEEIRKRMKKRLAAKKVK
ncbi:MAG: putative ABC transporter permease [Treponema sp.]|nr:putative ABC transporter permease [Treponema sp.]